MPLPPRGSLAVIIPVYGREDLTRAVLGDVAREPWVDVVVVDNRGDLCPDLGGDVLHPGSNLGWAGGCNFALRQLAERDRNEAFVLLNNDTRLSRGFFRQLLQGWRRSGAWLLGPVYDGVWPAQRAGHAGRAYSYRVRDIEREVPFLDGTCIFLPRPTLDDVGFLDADTFPRHGWGVDFDYAIRVRQHGGSVWVTERAFLHHEGNGTAGQQADGWRDLAWDEMTRGMRDKWGIAWPRLLREHQPSAAADRLTASPALALARCPAAVVVVGTDPAAAALAARAVNLAGLPPLPDESGCLLAALGEQALQRARAAFPDASAGPETLLSSSVVAEAVTDAALRCRSRGRPARSWFWNAETEPALVLFFAAAFDVQPVCVLAVTDPADIARRAPATMREGALAEWEQALRHALQVLVGLPVLVIPVGDALDSPSWWEGELREFLLGNGLPLIGSRPGEGLAELIRSAWCGLGPLARSADPVPAAAATAAQRQLADAVAALAGRHQRLPPVQLPPVQVQSRGLDDNVLPDAAWCSPDSTREGRHVALGRLRAEWAAWARYNQRRGVDFNSLVGIMVSRGVTEDVAREELGLLAAAGSRPAHGQPNAAVRPDGAAASLAACVPLGGIDRGQARGLLARGLPVPWDHVRSALCLAAGGGEGQAFAALGIQTTVVALCPEQLAPGRPAAARTNLGLECLRAGIPALRCLDGREYDLVYQPVSSCCLPDPGQLYASLARLLRPGGTYWVEHVNPLRLQLDGLGRWSGQGYRVVRPITGGEPDLLAVDDPVPRDSPGTWRHCVHSLQSLVGDVCSAGFELVDLRHRTVGDPSAAPGSAEHLAAFVPPLIAILACKADGRR